MMTVDDLPGMQAIPAERAESIRRALMDEVGSSRHAPHTTPHRRTRWLAVAAVAATVTGGLIALNPFEASNAYASWTAVPDQLAGGPLQAVGAGCQQRLTAHFRGQAANLSPTVGERRGKFTAVLMSSGNKVGVCVNGIPHGELGGLLTLSARSSQLLSVEAEPGLVSGPGAVRQAIGRTADPRIARIVVSTADGRQVTASMAGGLYLAWWPSGADASAVRGYDATGSLLATITP